MENPICIMEYYHLFKKKKKQKIESRNMFVAQRWPNKFKTLGSIPTTSKGRKKINDHVFIYVYIK